MATLPNLVARLRLELGDPALPFQARVVGDGVTDRFNLPVDLVEPNSLVVSVGGVVQMIIDDYSVEYRAGVVTLESPPADGTEVVVEGYHYETFLTEDLETFINAAFLRHTAGRDNDLGLPMTLGDLPVIEEYLLVILAQIDAIWAMITDAADEIDVRSPDGITIPVGQRYEQLMGLLQLKKRQYEEMAQQLNVGLNRIEVLNLRRVSRSTNRLVPLYKPMEYDQVSKGFTPDYGPVGTTVTIKGDKFTGVTEIRFGDTPAVEFEVLNDHVATAVVPEGATTGKITLVAADGTTATTHYDFTVGGGTPILPMGVAAQRLHPPIDDGLT